MITKSAEAIVVDSVEAIIVDIISLETRARLLAPSQEAINALDFQTMLLSGVASVYTMICPAIEKVMNDPFYEWSDLSLSTMKTMSDMGWLRRDIIRMTAANQTVSKVLCELFLSRMKILYPKINGAFSKTSPQDSEVFYSNVIISVAEQRGIIN